MRNGIDARDTGIDLIAETVEDQEFNHGRLRDIAVRIHQHENGPLYAADVVKVPGTVEERADGYVVTMIDGYGAPVEFVHLDLQEQVTKRVPA